MDLRKDYEAYKLSIAESAPDYYVEYAKITPTWEVDKFPTIFDYVRYVADNINKAIENDNEQEYSTWLATHKFAIGELFKKMAREMIKELGFDEVTPELLKQFKKEFGVRWSKHLTLGKV